MAEYAFMHGYLDGARNEALGARGRHAVEPDTHEHWRRGYEAGRAAARAARVEYRDQLIKAGETAGGKDQ